uniref:C2H2-type domain-containing protein n=1 Tax=Nothoprocta perdicaria TaxID=30464 RepID=A0A8C7EHP5_NOTPE
MRVPSTASLLSSWLPKSTTVFSQSTCFLSAVAARRSRLSSRAACASTRRSTACTAATTVHREMVALAVGSAPSGEKLPTPEVPLEKLEEEDDRNSGNDGWDAVSDAPEDAGKEQAPGLGNATARVDPAHAVTATGTFVESSCASRTAACQRGNSRNKFYVCPVCSKSFLLRINLLLHQRSHWVPYMCTHCGGSFTLAHHAALLRHQRLHTGERPFQCPACGKSFNEKSHLTKHYRIHTGERPFRCALPPSLHPSRSSPATLPAAPAPRLGLAQGEGTRGRGQDEGTLGCGP